MALNVSALRRALQHYFSSPTNQNAVAAQRLAKAYASYAANAVSCAGAATGASITLAEAALARTLTGVMKTAKTGDREAQAIAAALSVFWLAPPVVFSGAGLVTAAIPAGLQAGLRGINGTNQAVASRGGNIPAIKLASQWSQIIDSWTRTVIVTHVGIPCVGPIV